MKEIIAKGEWLTTCKLWFNTCSMFIASISKSKENVSKYILSQVPLLNLNSLKVLFSHQKIFDVEGNLDVGLEHPKNQNMYVIVMKIE